MTFTVSQRIAESPSFSGRVYPDGTFSIGYVPKKQKRIEDREYDANYENQHDSYEYTITKYGRTEKKTQRFFDKPITPHRFIKGLKSSQNSRKYGSKGITAYGKKCVSNIALLLQQRYTRFQLGFATFTVPPLSPEGARSHLELWGQILRCFLQELKRDCERRGEAFEYVGCTEIQPKRLASVGVPYLHLHLIYRAKNGRKSPWILPAHRMRFLWRRTLINCLGTEAFVNGSSEASFRASVDCQAVKKSASAYLGKYLSKGCAAVKALKEAGFTDFPRQWWTASMQWKRNLKKSVIRIDASTASDFFYRLGDYLEEGLITWASYVFVNFNNEERCFGLVGTLSEKAYSCFSTA